MYARLTSMCCGLLDWMPRYIPPGPLAVSKRVADRLFLRTCNLELEQAKDYCILAHRKTAWTVGPAQQLGCPSCLTRALMTWLDRSLRVAGDPVQHCRLCCCELTP